MKYVQRTNHYKSLNSNVRKQPPKGSLKIFYELEKSIKLETCALRMVKWL
jgi:hypothetical protein